MIEHEGTPTSNTANTPSTASWFQAMNSWGGRTARPKGTDEARMLGPKDYLGKAQLAVSIHAQLSSY